MASTTDARSQLDRANGSSVSVPLMRPWPATMPWMEFIASHNSDPGHLFPLRGAAKPDSIGTIRAAFRNKARNSFRRTKTPPPTLMPHAYLTAVGAGSVAKAIAKAETLDLAASEVAKSVPEIHDGEHADALLAMASGTQSEAGRAAFKMLVYQVSNNHVGIIPYEIDDEADDDDQYGRIVANFRELGPPESKWVKELRKSRGPSWKAFKEKLFAAAANSADIEVMKALLRSDADPDQPMMTMTSELNERPLQLAADSRMSNVEMATFLVREAVVDVTAVTEDNPEPALHIAAHSGCPDIVELLLERNRVGIYVDAPHPLHLRGPSWAVKHTPLIAALKSRKWLPHSIRYPSLRSVTDILQGHDSENEEQDHDTSEVFRTFQCILDHHKYGYQPADDKEIVQDALVLAATCAPDDVMEALIEAGGDVTQPNGLGVTPLMAAVSHWGRMSATALLIEEGAPVNEGPARPSALHMAALAGVFEAAYALITDYEADINKPARISCKLQALVGYSDKQLEDMAHTPLQLALHKEFETPRRLFTLTFGKARDKYGELVLELLKHGAKLVGGELVASVRFRSKSLLAALLERGADPHEKNKDGKNALQVLVTGDSGYNIHVKRERIQDKRSDIAQLLLDAGVTLSGGELWGAFRLGDRNLVSLIAKHGGQLTDTGPAGESILEAAYACRSRPLIALLNGRYSTKVPYDSKAFCMAVFQEATNPTQAPPGDVMLEHSDILELLKRRDRQRIDPVFEATALGIACYLSDDRTVRSLLELTSPPAWCIIPVRDEPLLSLDFIWGNNMLQWNLNVCYEDNKTVTGFWNEGGEGLIRCSVLVYALQYEMRWDNVRHLLGAGHHPCPLALLFAVKCCSAAQVDELLDYAGDVNETWRPEAPTVLQFAVMLKRVDLVRVLLKRGADVNALPGIRGPPYSRLADDMPNELRPRTALQAAVEVGHLELIALLLQAGANVNGPVSPDAGASCLQLAAKKGYLGIANGLLELGADVNCPRARNHGRTALEAAAEYGRLDMVHFLLRNGADTNGYEDGAREGGVGVWQWLRAIRFAKKGGHGAVAEILQKHRGMGVWHERCLAWKGLLSETFRVPTTDEVEKDRVPWKQLWDRNEAELHLYDYDSEEEDEESTENSEDDSEADMSEDYSEDNSEEDDDDDDSGANAMMHMWANEGEEEEEDDDGDGDENEDAGSKDDGLGFLDDSEGEDDNSNEQDPRPRKKRRTGDLPANI